MQKKFHQLLTSLSIFILLSGTAFPCTIFSLYPDGQNWVGRTFDWSYGHALVFTNKRNVSKKSVKLLPTDVESRWVSKYGSVTFNQFGREFPNGGMNEEGLLIEALELEESIFPPASQTPSFNELQFIQYVLDNFKSTEEVLSGIEGLRLSPVGSKLHYFVCDSTKCMTIEFIDGKLKTHSGSELPISGLANNTYAASAEYAKQFETFGGTTPVVQESKHSLDRFVRSNYKAKFINDSPDKIETLFSILDDVGGVNNRWQIIYNQNDKLITFRTKAQLDKIRSIDLKAIDFNCSQSSQYFDVDSAVTGPLNAELKMFDAAANYGLIKKSVEMQRLPAALADRLAHYPSETSCENFKD